MFRAPCWALAKSASGNSKLFLGQVALGSSECFISSERRGGAGVSSPGEESGGFQAAVYPAVPLGA